MTELNPIQKKVADMYLERMADKEYKRAVKVWNKERREEEERLYKQLRNPQFAVSYGLPEKLPAFTRKILKRTIALDRLVPKYPERPKIYRRYGLV